MYTLSRYLQRLLQLLTLLFDKKNFRALSPSTTFTGESTMSIAAVHSTNPIHEEPQPGCFAALPICQFVSSLFEDGSMEKAAAAFVASKWQLTRISLRSEVEDRKREVQQLKREEGESEWVYNARKMSTAAALLQAETALSEHENRHFGLSIQ